MRSPGVLNTPQARRRGGRTLTDLLPTEAEAESEPQGTSEQHLSRSHFHSDLPGGDQALQEYTQHEGVISKLLLLMRLRPT